MTDNLTTRALAAWADTQVDDRQAGNLLESALRSADAEVFYLRAQIADALDAHPRGKVYHRPGEGLVTTDDDLIPDGCQACEVEWPCATAAALSRGSQGAAEPNTEPAVHAPRTLGE